MKPRRISIAFQTDKTSTAYIDIAKLVNRYDFDMVSVYCDAPYHPSFGPLFLMAPHIKRARLGLAAVSPFRMHPIDIAANTALLASILNDRVYIGLARGAWLDDFGIHEPRKPIKGIREAADIIRILLRGEMGGYAGDVFKIANHVKAPYPLPTQEIPLMIGTWGPKLASLAGEIADDLKVGGSANPVVAGNVLQDIYRGNRTQGRPFGATELTVGAVTVVDADRERARKIAKTRLSLYLPVVAKLDPTVSLASEFIQRVQSYVSQADFQAAGKMISDELMKKFAFAGNPNDIIQQSESLFEAGVNRVEFGNPHGINPAEGIKILGEQVIPILKAGMQ